MPGCPRYGRMAVEFPYYFHVFGVALHPHRVMEGTAYAVGLGTHLAIKWRVRGGGGSGGLNGGCGGLGGGARAGAKVLAWAESWRAYAAQGAITGWEAWLDGKTIVGGLIGGW